MQLEKEKDALIRKQGSLEERINQLLSEKETYMQKEAGLEIKIRELEGEKDSWLQKEAGFEEKINHLVDEAAVLNLKVKKAEELLAEKSVASVRSTANSNGSDDRSWG